MVSKKIIKKFFSLSIAISFLSFIATFCTLHSYQNTQSTNIEVTNIKSKNRNTLVNTTPNYDVINNDNIIDPVYQSRYASDITTNDINDILDPLKMISWYNNLPSDYAIVDPLPVIVNYQSNDKYGTLEVTFKLRYAIVNGDNVLNENGFDQTLVKIKFQGFSKRLATTFTYKTPDESLNVTNIVDFFSGSLNTDLLESKANVFLTLENKTRYTAIKNIIVKRNSIQETVIEFIYNNVCVEQNDNMFILQNYPIQLKIIGFKPDWTNLKMSIIKSNEDGWTYTTIINSSNDYVTANNDTMKIIFFSMIGILCVLFLVIIITILKINSNKRKISVSL